MSLNTFFQFLSFFMIAAGSCAILPGCSDKPHECADMLLFHGKVLTVDDAFSVHEAVAVKEGKIWKVGTDEEILGLRCEHAREIDLQGHTLIPGLIEGHAHPIAASRSELLGDIPDIHTIPELLAWIKQSAGAKKPGEWIIHPKFFATRLEEMRQPTIRELDSVAPLHPVFLNGSYGGMINTKACEVSRIDKNTTHPGILKDSIKSNPTGFIRRSAFGMLALDKDDGLTPGQQLEALKNMFHLYNRNGITSVTDGGGSIESMKLYRELQSRGELTVRVFQNIMVPFAPGDPGEKMQAALQALGTRTGEGDEWVKTGALKAVIDGGVLTGTAYLREPWGLKGKDIYGISDPAYRGVLNIEKETLVKMINAAVDQGWKFTAHVTGGGGVDVLLSAYEEVNTMIALKGKRHSIIHGNFYTPESILKMAEMDIYADMQPAWFFKDTDLLREVLEEQTLRTFHPYQSLAKAGVTINGGSDHMVKLDANTSINPYNPFIAMWSVISRKTERGTQYYREEALTREQALRMYTLNNAKASFEENFKGSVEVGKLADMVVLSEDLLTCEEDRIKDVTVLITLVGGKIVYTNNLLSPR